jgi:predicted nucleic acid-binding protein
LIPPVIADTGGLLRALARTPGGKPSFPEYVKVLTSAATVIVSGLVLAEVDYFLRADRKAMRKLMAEVFDPATRYEYELPLPSDIARALELDARFKALALGFVDGTVAAVAEHRNATGFWPAIDATSVQSASVPASRAPSSFCPELARRVASTMRRAKGSHAVKYPRRR